MSSLRSPAAAALLLLSLLLLPGPANAAPGDWKTFTAKHTVRAVAVDAGGIAWAATSGGLFGYRKAGSGSEAFERSITTSEGLRTTDLTAIAVGADQTLWIGAANGMLHHYDPRKQTWEYISDIASLNTPQKQIDALAVMGDTVYVLSPVGVSIYRISRSEFGDTYTRFGSGAGQIVGSPAAIARFGGRLWIASASGIASTPAGNPNPSVAESWRIDNTASGLPSNDVRGFTAAGDSFYAATASGLAVLRGTSWALVPGTNGLAIVAIGVINYESGPLPAFVTATDLWRGPAASPGSMPEKMTIP